MRSHYFYLGHFCLFVTESERRTGFRCQIQWNERPVARKVRCQGRPGSPESDTMAAVFGQRCCRPGCVEAGRPISASRTWSTRMMSDRIATSMNWRDICSASRRTRSRLRIRLEAKPLAYAATNTTANSRLVGRRRGGWSFTCRWARSIFVGQKEGGNGSIMFRYEPDRHTEGCSI